MESLEGEGPRSVGEAALRHPLLLALSAAKPLPKRYSAEPKTLGQHLRKIRLNLGLLQREVVELIGVNASTVQNWEHGHTEPALRHWPALIEFLGLVPFEVSDSLGERIRAWRTIHGVPRSELAKRIGIDPSTVWRRKTKEAYVVWGALRLWWA